MNKIFHVGRPNIPDRANFIQRIHQVLDNQWLTNIGPLSLELEDRISTLLQVKHCICVSNATSGLELLQRSLDLQGEVIIPAFTFVATAHSLRWQRIDPIFCDVRLEDHLIDTEQIESLITPNTSAILAVPIWGQPCDNEALQAISRKHGLKLIFDTAHGFGCKCGDRFLGNFGDAEVFSLHATKVFSTGEGGAITTNSDELAEKLRLMRNFGFAGRDIVQHIGTNAKMSEFAAAFGLANFEQLDSIIAHNRRIHDTYLNAFRNLSGIQFLEYSAIEHISNYHYVVARVHSKLQESMLEFFHRENILIRRYFYPGIHRMEPYHSDPRYESIYLPNTETLASEMIIFPTGEQIQESDVYKFADLYTNFINSHTH